MTDFAGTWKRLPSGEWGVWIESQKMPKYGDKVQVTRKDGKFTTETIEEVVSEPPGAFVVSLLKETRQHTEGVEDAADQMKLTGSERASFIRDHGGPYNPIPEFGDPDDFGHN